MLYQYTSDTLFIHISGKRSKFSSLWKPVQRNWKENEFIAPYMLIALLKDLLQKQQDYHRLSLFNLCGTLPSNKFSSRHVLTYRNTSYVTKSQKLSYFSRWKWKHFKSCNNLPDTIQSDTIHIFKNFLKNNTREQVELLLQLTEFLTSYWDTCLVRDLRDKNIAALTLIEMWPFIESVGACQLTSVCKSCNTLAAF